MTQHGKKLLAYVMCHLAISSRDPALRRQYAEKWLDDYLPNWRESKLPKAKRRSLLVSTEEDEDEQS
ncbi:hypothetical protein L2728_11430 [Shewanella chilikensis]|jgi:hypothetical protein|uniref:hypothetical protein n=1 Tax=Shewanella TaxID=22 RepID=UPI000F42C50D|nr:MULTISPECIES: hypothetical protein [Shewanella]AYV14350.1 hypothetical protein EEY24_16530 [Shewanella algae]MCL1162485.1 hypothetical protein [Shewanella chilikensis]